MKRVKMMICFILVCYVVNVYLRAKIQENDEDKIVILMKKLVNYDKLLSITDLHSDDVIQNLEHANVTHLNLTNLTPEPIVKDLLHYKGDKKAVIDKIIHFLSFHPEIRKKFIRSYDSINTVYQEYLALPNSFLSIDDEASESAADKIPPLPYTSTVTPCMNAAACLAKKLSWMK